MARNGAGVFVRLYNWVTDAAGGIKILATRMDAEFDGMATALTDSIAKDGQTTPTANLPMGGFKHTNIANASTRDQYSSAGQVQDGSLVYAADTGAANAYVIAPNPAYTSYSTGMCVLFKAANTNTTISTININALGVKTIKKDYNTDLTAGDVIANQIYEVVYDGTNFQLISASRSYVPQSDQNILAMRVYN